MNLLYDESVFYTIKQLKAIDKWNKIFFQKLIKKVDCTFINCSTPKEDKNGS